MMIRTLITFVGLAFVALSAGGAPTSGKYIDDPQRFFVEGQPLTDSIEAANAIICYMSAMRPDALVNEGPYVAKFYEDRCETSGSNESSEQASATATSAESSTTASSSDGATSYETEQASEAILDVKRAKEEDPVSAKVWVDDEAQDAFDFDKTIYVQVEQTAGVSDEAPNGDFEMWFSGHSNGVAEFFEDEIEDALGAPLEEIDLDEAGLFIPEEGQAFFQGYLKASGSEIKYKEFSFDGENNIALEYLDNGDITGVYGQSVCIGCDTSFGSPEGGEPTPTAPIDGSGQSQPVESVEATLFYQFYVRKQTKTYCRSLTEAVQLCFPDDTSEECQAAFAQVDKNDVDYNAFEPIKLAYDTDDIEAYLQENGDPLNLLDDEKNLITEQCFSMNRDDATRNVFRYGVYESDGDRLTTGETGAFPIFAEVEREETSPNGEIQTRKDRVFGFADYWGVFIDPRGRQLIKTGTDGTVFKKETFGPLAPASSETYTLETTELRIEKREKSFIALEDLDQIKIAMHIQDPWWASEYKCLLGLATDGCDSGDSDSGSETSADPAAGPFGGGDVFNLTLEGFATENDDPLSVQELEGYYDAEQDLFVFNRVVSFEQGYYAKDLESGEEITFSPADWVSTMVKEFDDFGDGSVFKDIRSMGVWSNDTRQWYDISAAALNDPTLSDPEDPEGGECPTDPFATEQTSPCRGGIRTETTEIVTPAELEGLALVCIRDCVDPELLQKAFSEAYEKAQASSNAQGQDQTEGGDGSDFSVGTSPSDGGNYEDFNSDFVTAPFADVGPYLKDTITVFEANSRFSPSYNSARDLPRSFFAVSNPLEEATGDYTFLLDRMEAQLIDSILVKKDDWTQEGLLDGRGNPVNIGEDVSVKSYLLVQRDSQLNANNAEQGTAGVLPLEIAESFNTGRLNLENLQALVTGQGGTSPVISLDLRAIPKADTTGTTSVRVMLSKKTGEVTEMLEAVVKAEWQSGGPDEGFQIVIPEGSYTVKHLAGATAIEASFSNSEADLFAYSSGVLSTKKRPGITLRLLSLFNGSRDQDSQGFGGALKSKMAAFFDEESQYSLEIAFGQAEGQIDPVNFGVVGNNGNPVGPMNTVRWKFSVVSSAPDPDFGFSEVISAQGFTQGEYWDGVRLSEAVSYVPTATGLGMKRLSTNEVLTKGDAVNSFLLKSTDPFQALGNARYKRPGQDFGDNLSWGVRTGNLVAVKLADLQSGDPEKLGDLAGIECNKFGGQYENHPAFSGDEETEFRLCEQQLFQNPNLTTYQIQIDTQPAYALIDASGDPVVIASPKTLYYDVPDDEEAYPRDAGKRISLEFAGHGELRGIPGFVYDQATGEDLGEFVREWKPTYRYINRFNIPDGGMVTDTEGTEYFVKALDGEEWLKELEGTEKVAASEAGNYSLTRADLVKNSTLKLVKPVIGEPPEDDALLNEGAPSVIHGEVVYSD